jgi:metallophosphoesterase (TIGR03768 family)
MKTILRRDFLKYCAGSAAALGLQTLPFRTLDKALASLGGAGVSEPTYPIAPSYLVLPYTTLDKTVVPVVPGAPLPDPPEIAPCLLSQYESIGYGFWNVAEDGSPDGPGSIQPYPVFGYACPSLTSASTLTPGNATDPEGAAMLLRFFSISDVHICDKESPARNIYYGAYYPRVVNAAGQPVGDSSRYSGIILYTTHVLDAAIQTINALHQVTPFDFGIALGDACDNTQLNELRWYIDVIDGKRITPSSGAHLGAGTIDYQKPYQAAGLDKSIHWYQVMGNHDQFFIGSCKVNDKIRTALVGKNVLNIGLLPNPSRPGAADWKTAINSTGYYMGVMNGMTEDGLIDNTELMYGGPEQSFHPAPQVAADPNRRSLTPSQWMAQFFNTTSKPVGHGFTQANVNAGFACYSFKPKAGVPVKIIVLDDTDKVGCGALSALDSKRFNWLVNQLEAGQKADELMIVCAHIPINPYQQAPGTTYFPETWAPYSEISLDQLLETLFSYSNFVLWIAGHIHRNTITPQPNPNYPEAGYGFWEIESPCLRDFPQQFRRFQIGINSQGNLSIFVDSVDTAVDGSVLYTPGVTPPAAISRSYTIGATEIFGTWAYYGSETPPPMPIPGIPSVQQGPNMDPVSGVYNAECQIQMNQLSPGLQIKLANIAPSVNAVT